MSAGEIVMILFVYLLLFGAKGVPALAQTMGKAVYQFRNAAKDVQNEIMSSANEIKKQANIKLDQIDLGLEDEEHPHQQKSPSIPRRAEPAPAAKDDSTDDKPAEQSTE